MIEKTVFSHRGLNRVAPENTMSAFRAAAAAGAQWIETDVDILGDGTPIIIHDSRLDRTTNQSGSYYDLSINDLDRIDAGSWFSPEFSGERLPLLRDVVDLMNETGLNANIEIKSNEGGKAMTLELVDRVVAELERLKPGRHVIISSFSLLILQMMRDRAPKLPRGVLFGVHSLGLDWRSVLEILEATYIHPADTTMTKERIQLVRSAGYGVNVWTVNDVARATELFEWGATGIFTDVADHMLDLAQ